MELASFQQVPSEPELNTPAVFGVRPSVREALRPFIPALVAQFLYVFDCITCIETWISEPERIGGVRIEPPFRIWLAREAVFDAGVLQTAWGTHGPEVVRALNMVLPAALDVSGFAEVREEGYPDRLLVLPKSMVFAYEDPTKAFSEGLCVVDNGMRVSTSLTAHRRACSVLKHDDGVVPVGLEGGLLSALLTYGHTGKSFVVIDG